MKILYGRDWVETKTGEILEPVYNMHIVRYLQNMVKSWKSAPITRAEAVRSHGSKPGIPRSKPLLENRTPWERELQFKPILRNRPRNSDEIAKQNGWTIERNEDLKHQIRLNNQELRIYATNLAKRRPDLSREQHQKLVENYARQQTERRSSNDINSSNDNTNPMGNSNSGMQYELF